MKVDLETVKLVLQRNELDIRVVSQIVEDIQTEVTAEAEAEEKAPAVKKQFVILVSDPNGKLDAAEGEVIGTGWVLQVPEDESPIHVQERLIRSAYDFNLTPKGRRIPLKTIAEVCEHVSSRVAKEHRVWIRTKEPVFVLRTSNKVPLEEIEKLRKAAAK